MKDKHLCHTSTMDDTMDSKHKPDSMEVGRFHCCSCDYVCDDRRMLCVHQNYQPYPRRDREAPWDAGDQTLRDMYEDNRIMIFSQCEN